MMKLHIPIKSYLSKKKKDKKPQLISFNINLNYITFLFNSKWHVIKCQKTLRSVYFFQVYYVPNNYTKVYFFFTR